MADTGSFIPELDTASTIGLNDLLLLTQVNSQVETGYESLKVLVSTLANFIVNGIQYTQDLDTSSKTIIDAINQVLSNLADTYDLTSTYDLNDCVVYQGTLYKCTTAITVAEAWDSTHWTQIKAVDVGAGGGGAGGGHVIIDNDGTSLTQRSNLQFIGAYSEDNSTDDTTEVNVVRSMTKAEFDLLSADEKQGIINVTDDVSGGLKYVKTVLWKNIDEDNMTIITDGDTITLSDNIFDYDEVYFEACFLDPTLPSGNHMGHLVSSKVLKDTLQLAKSKSGSQTFQGIFDVGLNYVYYGGNYSFNYSLKIPTDNSLYVAQKFTVGWTASNCTLTRIIGIKYLSDSENTYSTDEHIVGKWIDGSTVYEKTFVHTVTGANTYIDLTDLNIDKLIKMDALSYQAASNNVISVPYCWDSSDRALMFYNLTNKHLTFNGSSYNFGEWYITIRYTKSST